MADRQRTGRGRHPLVAAAAWLACGLATPASADIRIDGNPRILQLTANGDSLADVLSRLERMFAVKYRSAVPLGAEIRGTYSGSLSQVVGRLLDGYNYVIKNDRDLTEIVVLGRAGEVAVVSRTRQSAPVPIAPAKNVTSRWR